MFTHTPEEKRRKSPLSSHHHFLVRASACAPVIRACTGDPLLLGFCVILLAPVTAAPPPPIPPQPLPTPVSGRRGTGLHRGKLLPSTHPSPRPGPARSLSAADGRFSAEGSCVLLQGRSQSSSLRCNETAPWRAEVSLRLRNALYSPFYLLHRANFRRPGGRWSGVCVRDPRTGGTGTRSLCGSCHSL